VTFGVSLTAAVSLCLLVAWLKARVYNQPQQQHDD